MISVKRIQNVVDTKFEINYNLNIQSVSVLVFSI